MVRDDADALHYLLNANPLPSNKVQHSSIDLDGGCMRTQTYQIGSTHLSPSDAAPMQTSPHRVEDASHSQLAQPVVLSAEQFSLWSQFESCAQHFLSPVEAATYMNYFFNVIHEQMPVLSDWFRGSHDIQSLLVEEPVLCSTILCIASRYLRLQGYGAQSRGQLLHDHFFTRAQKGLQFLMWGFPTNRQSGMTSIGAIEALLLLMSWQPRGLFSQLSMLPSVSTASTAAPSGNSTDDHGDSLRNQALTMTLRADAMNWRLASLAASLAFEARIYDPSLVLEDSILCSGAAMRIRHTRRILYIFTTSLAARLRRQNHFQEISSSFFAIDRNSLTSQLSSTKQTAAFDHWIELIELGSVAGQALASCARDTDKQIRDNKLTGITRHFSRSLHRWWEDFRRFDANKFFSYNMELLYHYHRIRLLSVTLTDRLGDKESATRAHAVVYSSSFRPDSILTWDMHELLESCWKVYEIMIEMHAIQALVTIPGPLLLRLVTVSILVLKVISVNPAESKDLLALFDRAIAALRESAVDDLHFAGCYGQLLEGLSRQIQVQRSRRASESANHAGDLRTAEIHNTNNSSRTDDMNATTLEEHDFLNSHSYWDTWIAFPFDFSTESMTSIGF